MQLFVFVNSNCKHKEITESHGSKIKEMCLIHMYKYFDWEKQRRDIIYSIVSHWCNTRTELLYSLQAYNGIVLKSLYNAN
jgi:hypothetical protein